MKNEQKHLIKDSVLTKYQNFLKFFSFEWRNDTVNSFLLHLSKRESMLPDSFFKHPNGEDDHTMKIAYVWSKIPGSYRKEMQRNGVLQTIEEWSDFERALRNAEIAVSDTVAKPNRWEAEEGPTRGKRQASSQGAKTWAGKKQDRKAPAQTHQASRDETPTTDRRLTATNEKNQDSHSPSNWRGNRKAHWRNREVKKDEEDKNRRDDQPGKDEP